MHNDDKHSVKIREVITLKKFDGDDQTQEPVEVLVVEVEDGKEVKRTHTVKGDKSDGSN